MPKIFESPDGGKTVYSREFGEHQSWMDRQESKFIEQILWKDILAAAEHSPTLQEAVDRVKVLYYLSKKDGNKET
jgi:hypothetical protein